MSTRRYSQASMQGLVRLFHRYKSWMVGNDSYHRFSSPLATTNGFGQNYRTGQGLDFIGSINIGGSKGFYTNRNVKKDMYSDKTPSPPPPPRPGVNFTLWARWVLGSVLSMFLPFWHQKWQKLKRIEGEAELVVEGAEIVAEAVERAAMAAEKVSAELAEKLPDHSKLKETALAVEHIAEVAAHDAHVAKTLLLKVDEIKQDLEAMVEPVVDKIIGADGGKQHKTISKPSRENENNNL